MTSFFEVLKHSSNSRARLGNINTAHGEIKTPSFIFCGTKATVKSILPQQLKLAKTQIILSNTYHLMIQPGPEIVAQEKGLQNFTQWGGPMMTDSGGYQIFSLGHGSVSEEIKGKNKNIKRKSLIKISEEGATFRNYLNGDKVYLTPERSIELQRHFGADLIFVLDECTPFNVSKKYTENSMYLSHRWAKRCSAAFKTIYANYESQMGSAGKQYLYGIVQGGVYEDLRKIAPKKDLPLTKIVINKYCVGDWIPPHNDDVGPAYCSTLHLEDSEEGLSYEGGLSKNKAGYVNEHPMNFVHWVEPASEERYSIIFLYHRGLINN